MIELPKLVDWRGSLSFVEAANHIPFPIARVYWVYDIPGGGCREGRALRSQHEVIIALSGSFDVVLSDGWNKRRYTINRSYQALHVPNMMWREMENFSTNAICLVIASGAYNENDYIRQYEEFRGAVRSDESDTSFQRESKIVKREVLYNTIADCSLIDFPVIQNRSGNITSVHGSLQVPFNIERVFYIYDIPNGAERGMHAHKHCHEILVAVSGSFDVELDDGIEKRIVRLNRPMKGLHIPPGVWAIEKDYSSGAVCLVLASEVYDPNDYINTYTEFKNYRSSGNKAI